MTSPRRLLTSLWSAAAYRPLFMTVRRFAVGRRLTLRVDDADLTMTVTALDAADQLTDITATAEDINWRTSHFDRATVRLQNMRMKPGAPLAVVAGPVDVTLDVPAPTLADLLRASAPRLAGAIGADGVARVGLTRRPRLGYVEVEARLDDAALWLTARRIGIGARRWRLPTRTPAYPVRLPEMAGGLQLTGVAFAPGIVRVSGTLPQWRADLGEVL
ncbi:hypothetical protein MPRF_39770 [Mycolicibacterium parafortuitum]|uniref:DUF2993 domain-containing protein n=1 Tax=Mycolicibacterium parafortuitum TaxID=39692 RepID=A0A7I7U6W5_MYCPF|nr:hypothetical protein [Mycolicibacterium parafortuitum]BBY77078.1 hypothetical protein MPRF_39770 [Mycolicibacterium parafortuitum]